MRIIKDLSGQKFGRLTAIEPAGYVNVSNGNAYANAEIQLLLAATS